MDELDKDLDMAGMHIEGDEVDEDGMPMKKPHTDDDDEEEDMDEDMGDDE